MARSNRPWLAALAVFVALSVTDFAQTYALILDHGGVVYESNPVAGPWLERYGWSGLAAYKVGAVVVVALVVLLLARQNRRAATGVGLVGCAAVLAVTLYSRDLIANGPRPEVMSEEEVAAKHGLYGPAELGRPIDRSDIERMRASRPAYAGESARGPRPQVD